MATEAAGRCLASLRRSDAPRIAGSRVQLQLYERRLV